MPARSHPWPGASLAPRAVSIYTTTVLRYCHPLLASLIEGLACLTNSVGLGGRGAQLRSHSSLGARGCIGSRVGPIYAPSTGFWTKP